MSQMMTSHQEKITSASAFIFGNKQDPVKRFLLVSRDPGPSTTHRHIR